MNEQAAKTTNRLSETVLSLGIPAVAYLEAGGSLKTPAILPEAALILLGAWHVLAINDEAFAFDGTLKSFIFETKASVPKLAPPLAIMAAVPFAPLPALTILATILVWDVYSLIGKRQWLASLLFNFMGGATHFLIGAACAAPTPAEFAGVAERSFPAALFFAFAMVSGAMHHEAYDVDEDGEGGYVTGAVRFSPNLWWRLACAPILLSLVPLFFTDEPFKSCFLAAVAAYIASYSVFAISAVPHESRSFRAVCRLTFIAAAALFAYFKTSTPP